jgi:uncharacterized protein with PIN domain
MNNCAKCNTPLIKQLIGKDGKPLTQEEKDLKERYDNAYKQTLECRGCGNLCYRRNVESENDGSGLCKKCGGTDLINRPKDIPNFQTMRYIQYPELWSCPTCGVIGRN